MRHIADRSILLVRLCSAVILASNGCHRIPMPDRSEPNITVLREFVGAKGTVQIVAATRTAKRRRVPGGFNMGDWGPYWVPAIPAGTWYETKVLYRIPGWLHTDSPTTGHDDRYGLSTGFFERDTLDEIARETQALTFDVCWNSDETVLSAWVGHEDWTGSRWYFKFSDGPPQTSPFAPWAKCPEVRHQESAGIEWYAFRRPSPPS